MVFDLKANIIFSDTTFSLSKSETIADLSPKATPSEINFNFASLDSQLEQLVSVSSGQFNPPPGGTPFTDLMVEIGTGGYSAKLKKAERIIEGALSTAKRISQLASGDLVSLPFIMEKMIGQNNVQIIIDLAKIYSKFTEIEVYIKIEMAQENENISKLLL